MILLLLALCHGNLVQAAYAKKDVEGLATLLAEAEVREDSLLARYRLFALTREHEVLRDLPKDLDSATARELALLSALWAYRIPSAGLFQLFSYGRRSNGLLRRALDADPNDPLVRLIEAQSLLFRPGIAGGDTELALELLLELRLSVRQPCPCGLGPLEIDLWLWYAMERADHPDADRFRNTLEGRALPALYREFLLDPP